MNAQKKQKKFYSGKKKNHTLKSQVVVNQKTGEIICTYFDKGKDHDFKMFKESKLPLHEKLKCLGYKGYQGIKKYHKNTLTPKKKPKNSCLTKEDKIKNKELARLRIIGEHINRKLKVFRILSERYRNRHKRFTLRFNFSVILFDQFY